jgi:hypothetical protein
MRGASVCRVPGAPRQMRSLAGICCRSSHSSNGFVRYFFCLQFESSLRVPLPRPGGAGCPFVVRSHR